MVPSQRGSKSLSRTFSFTIPGWWNDLPTPIWTAGSLSVFKQQLKTHLFQLYLITLGGAARGYMGVPPVERLFAMQMCPYTVSTRQGKLCLLFRAFKYSSGLIRRGLCGLWRCCLHITLWRYCRFFWLKALRDMHGGGHDPEVLKELRSAPDLAPRATKVMARSLGRAMSTLVVQEHHLWLCLVDIGTPTKFGSSRFLYPRLASSATQPVTWPSSSRLHRSRVRRSNMSCLGGQLLPPPVRQLQHPACSSLRAAPCVHPRSRTASVAAFKKRCR